MLEGLQAFTKTSDFIVIEFMKHKDREADRLPIFVVYDFPLFTIRLIFRDSFMKMMKNQLEKTPSQVYQIIRFERKIWTDFIQEIVWQSIQTLSLNMVVLVGETEVFFRCIQSDNHQFIIKNQIYFERISRIYIISITGIFFSKFRSQMDLR